MKTITLNFDELPPALRELIVDQRCELNIHAVVESKTENHEFTDSITLKIEELSCEAGDRPGMEIGQSARNAGAFRTMGTHG